MGLGLLSVESNVHNADSHGMNRPGNISGFRLTLFECFTVAWAFLDFGIWVFFFNMSSNHCINLTVSNGSTFHFKAHVMHEHVNGIITTPGFFKGNIKIDDAIKALTTSWLAPFDAVVSFHALDLSCALAPAPFMIMLL